MDIIKQALKEAVKELESRLTTSARSATLVEGWAPHIVDSLQVSRSEDSFTTTVDDEFSAEAFDHEYGTETSAPKGTLRKFGTSDQAAGKEFFRLFEKYLDTH